MKNYESIGADQVDQVARAPESDVAAIDPANPHPWDHLAPPFGSDERPSSLFVGTFNLIATIVGGGVLSLPIVFEKCGVAFTTIGMLLSAYMTYVSLVMLCYCGRRGGGSSYGEVVRSAFGERAEEAVSWLLFAFLWFVIVAYMILIRDIWTPLARQILGRDVDGDRVLLAVVALLLPLLFQRSLHALRWNCYIGSASIFILCVALCRGGWQNLHRDGGDGSANDALAEDYGDGASAIQVFKIPSLRDVLFSFPIMALSFLCHFNIVSIQNALVKPTRQRMQSLIRYAIGASFVLSYSFGLGGYLYAGARTEGNILLNVPMAREDGEDEAEYYLFLLGRIGCGTTVVLATPVMLLPCRESLLEVIDVWFHHTHHRSDADGSEEQGVWKALNRCNSLESEQDAEIRTEDELIEQQSVAEGEQAARRPSVLIRQDPIQSDYVFRNALLHYGSTLLITATCYLVAVAVTGVAVVWSFIGSSMAFFIAFILPFGCFTVIESAVPTAGEGGDREGGWIGLAWAMLLFAVLGTIICTANNALGLLWQRAI